MPPSIWPTACCGFRMRPTSWVVATSTVRSSPRSASTSTTARWAAKAKGHVRVALAVVVDGGGGCVVVLDLVVEVPLGGDLGEVPAESPPAETTRPSRSANSPAGMPVSADTWVSTLSRTPSQAASTAPPDIHVWRLAEEDPAEPMAVSAGSSSTCRVPSTSRAICWARVTNPCPTSTQAQVTVATPSESRQAAVE